MSAANGRGIDDALVRHVNEHAKRAGYARVVILQVRSEAVLIEGYRKLGEREGELVWIRRPVS